MINNEQSEKLQSQIDLVLNAPLKVGDLVYVQDKNLYSYSDGKKEKLCKIINLSPLTVETCDSIIIKQIKEDQITRRDVSYVGANPFGESINSIRSVAFTLDSIISILYRDENYKIQNKPIHNVNWNPFVYMNGAKHYYQRDFVWSLENKQCLVDSIYQYVGCGSIILRSRSWEELDQMADNGDELAFYDVVDGKQRLHTIIEFINNFFPDSQGNYYNDLSRTSKRKFLDHQLSSYFEMENATDKEVIAQFLKVNFSGIPQSKEHIEYVKSILKPLTVDSN